MAVNLLKGSSAGRHGLSLPRLPAGSQALRLRETLSAQTPGQAASGTHARRLLRAAFVATSKRLGSSTAHHNVWEFNGVIDDN